MWIFCGFERALGYVSREEFLLNGVAWLPSNWDPDRDSYAELFYAEDIARNEADSFWTDIQKSFVNGY